MAPCFIDTYEQGHEMYNQNTNQRIFGEQKPLIGSDADIQGRENKTACE